MNTSNQYGPTLLTRQVATKEDLGQLVLCTQKLPDVSEVIVGTTMQLITSQRGYTATHFYKMVDGKWVDVTTAYGPSDNRSVMPVHEITPEQVTDTDGTYYTGYLQMRWSQVEDNSMAGPLIYDVVIRKLDTYPTHPGDGQTVVRAPKIAGTSTHEYKFFDDAMSEDTLTRYKYTVFHVFASGWWSYTNIN